MPIYTFLNTETGDIVQEMMSIAERDKYLKTPLVTFPSYYSDGVMGQFRLASNGKGLTQQQDQNGATWGHSDWLFLLQDRIVMVNDFVDTFTWKDASYFKSFAYSDIQQIMN